MRLFKSGLGRPGAAGAEDPGRRPDREQAGHQRHRQRQGQVESQNFESRKNVLQYDDVMDRQRKVIYAERREVLEGVDLEEQIRASSTTRLVATSTARRRVPRAVGPRRPVDRLKQIYPSAWTGRTWRGGRRPRGLSTAAG